VRLIWWMVQTGGRRAAACASFFGLRSPKVSSRLTFWPEAISKASMFTFANQQSLGGYPWLCQLEGSEHFILGPWRRGRPMCSGGSHRLGSP